MLKAPQGMNDKRKEASRLFHTSSFEMHCNVGCVASFVLFGTLFYDLQR